MLKLNSIYLLFFILFSGCSQNAATYDNGYISKCKNIIKPQWLNDEYVGVSRITASGSKSEQKQIAFRRAIAILLMTKGSSKGSSIVSVQKELKTSNEKEFYTKRFKENVLMKIQFKDIDYDVKIVNMWEDPCTKEIYIKIKEK